MKYLKMLVILLLSLNSFLFGQLTEMKEKNMLTEAKIFKDSKGISYSTMVKFGFNEKMVDINKGEKSVSLGKIKSTNFKNILKKIRKRIWSICSRKGNTKCNMGRYREDS